jgi:2TM domain-containing protein
MVDNRGEHERTAKAAQEVDKRIAFYAHFAVFLLVCAGLAAVNWLATPQVWWAQWPFLGWGVAVVFHGLCAFNSGPNVVAGWRLGKIRELAAPERAVGADRAASNPAKIFGILLLGILIGCAAGGGYMYVLLQDARESTRKVQESRDAFETTVKQRDEQLKQVSSEKSSLEATVKETKDQLAQAQAAKDAAERALAEAKKGAPQ